MTYHECFVIIDVFIFFTSFLILWWLHSPSKYRAIVADDILLYQRRKNKTKEKKLRAWHYQWWESAFQHTAREAIEWHGVSQLYNIQTMMPSPCVPGTKWSHCRGGNGNIAKQIIYLKSADDLESDVGIFVTVLSFFRNVPIFLSSFSLW